MVNGEQGLFGLVAVGNQAADHVDQAVGWRAMTRMFKLGNVL